MMTNNFASQSTAARNSANTSFLLSATSMFLYFGYVKKEFTELDKTDLVGFIAESIRECKASTHFCLEFGDERYCIFLLKGDEGYFVTVDETSSKTVQRPVKEIIRHYFYCFRLTEKNINNIATYIYDLVADYFYGVYEAETANAEAEISEAPVLDETPSLDEAPMLEDDDNAERIAAVIKEYYNNYIPSYLDQFGECVITVYWNRFSEADMMMLIENEKVALAVRDILLSDNIILDKNGFLVYDDGVYLTVDYNKIAKKVAA